MRKSERIFLVIALGTSSAFGGIVSFDPVTVDVQAGETTTLEVTVAGATSMFDTADILIGSDDLTLVDFVYSAAWEDAFQNVTPPNPSGAGFYAASDLFLGGNNPQLLDFPSLLVGTLTIDTTGLDPGSYMVFVDSARDGFSNLGNRNADPQADPLVGFATITVTGSSDPGGDGTDGGDGDPIEPPPDPTDTDGDGIPDETDPDDDNDGVIDADDAFPLDPSETTDSDNDGVGDNSDAFPMDGTETMDTDNDGTGNNADPDDDNDGVVDTEDAFPLDPTEQTDNDGNGIGDNADAAALDSNTGPRASGGICGMGMLGGFLFTLIGLRWFSIVDLRYRNRC